MPSYTLKKIILKEGTTISVPTGKSIMVVAVFRIVWSEDGVTQLALEVWYAEVTP